MPHQAKKSKKRKRKTVSNVALPMIRAIKKRPRPSPPKSGAALASKTYSREESHRELTASIAAAAKAMPAGQYTNILKSALAGYAAGSEIGAAISRHRASKAASAKKKTGGKTQGTVSDAAAKQMSRAQAKDPSTTKRV
jgi:hypothetical protein